MKPLKIYLADLTHDTIILVSDTVPINVGFVGSYAKSLYGDDIDVSLFKYPQSVIDAIKTDPPDVLALSNYSWNSYLSERMAQLAKEVNPNVVTVLGGTNFPHEASLYKDFLQRRPHTDFHVELEGEVAFANLVARVLGARDGGDRLFDSPVDGCVFIEPSTRLGNEAVVVAGVIPPRLRDLDAIPSPYLNGMLDHFFDGRLTPFLETNRGCPFKCSFCHTGNDYFQKTNMFSIERVQEEINYIAPRVSALGIVNLHIADTNFGMYPRDRDICIALREAHDKYGWPSQIMATTGKNNKERVIDITGIMGKMFSVNMSAQSMDPTVLSNIRRENIKLDDFAKIHQHLNEQGRATKGELILGMPGETRESFLGGVEQLIESGISSLGIYTLMLLNGTEFQNPEYREKFEIVGKFRIVPLDFGEYDGVRVLDYEEVGVQTKDMSFDDYLYLRSFALLVEALHNSRPFEEFFRTALSLGVSRFGMLRRISDSLETPPKDVMEILQGFRAETQGELWNSGEELVAHYQDDENYEKLRNGEVGGNLIYKYKALSIVFAAEGWISVLGRVCNEIAREKLEDPAAIQQEETRIELLSRFCRMKLAGILNVEEDVAPIEMESPYDVVGWLQSSEGTPLDHYRTAASVHYQFYFTKEQLEARADQFKRYGTEINALSKIVTRVSNVESLFRSVRTPESEQIIYADTDRDRFTRYSLAG
jgi:radical SAM superfamily enzyme YgiQ (UPF0313 family)